MIFKRTEFTILEKTKGIKKYNMLRRGAQHLMQRLI